MRPLLGLLACIVATWAQEAPALLNHFYATVDARTYLAIEASAFLQEKFAPFEKRTTVRKDSTYSGLYFYGQSTYFEFFEENAGDRKAGDAGLALGMETAGASDVLKTKWSELQPAVVTMVTREIEGKQADWFSMTSFVESREKSAVEGFRLFAMEYAPEFLYHYRPGTKASLKRSDILESYCRKLSLMEVRKNALLGDVSRVVIGGPIEGLRLRARQLEKAGWTVKFGDKQIDCAGPGASFTLIASTRPVGVMQVEFQLQREYLGPEQAVGKTTLRFLPNRKAIWVFN